MYSRLFIFLTLLLLKLHSYSQDTSCVKKFEQRTLYQYRNGYEINGQKLKHRQLKTSLNKFNDASAEYNSFHKKTVVSGILSLGSLIMEGIGAAIAKNNKGVANGLFISGLAALAISLPISISARNHLQKSVWLYNRNVMAY